MFCVIFVGLTGIILRFVVGAADLAITATLHVANLLKPSLSKIPAIRRVLHKRRNRKPRDQSAAKGHLQKSPSFRAFILELVIAVALGLLMVKSYENDFAFKIVNRVMSTEKLSAKDTLDYVSDQIAKKDWIRIDQRPDDIKLCKKGPSNCDDDVYVRISFKGSGDIYEGAFVYYQSSGERLGMFLSPACVRRRLEQGAVGALRVIPGPGVYVNVAEINSIEYWGIEDSECFKLFYPHPKKL